MHRRLKKAVSFSSRRARQSKNAKPRRLALEAIEPRHLLATMPLDTSFDSDGLVVADTSFSRGSEDILNAVHVVSGDKVWAAGRSQSGSGYVGSITRLNADGTADATFGAGGRMISTRVFEFQDVKGLADGGALATGFGNGPNGNHDFVVVKFLADGSLDQSFGTSGIAYADFGGDETPYSLAVKSDGSFVVAGEYNGDFAVAKFLANGTLDTSFSADGLQTVDFLGFNDRANEVMFDTAGRVVLAGYAYNGSNYDFALARLTTAGTPDNTFGTAGKVRTDFAAAARDDQANSLVLQSSGDIVAAGYTVNANGDKDFALARYSSAGNLQAGFGTNGQQVIDFTQGLNPSDDEAFEVQLDSAGQIVVAGSAAETVAPIRIRAAVAVLNGVSGQLVTSFDPNTGGRLYYDFFAQDNNIGAALAIDSQGRWMIGSSAGYSYPNFGITRVSGTTGVVDTTYGNAGRVSYDFNDLQGLNDQALGTALRPSGGLLIAGQTSFNYATLSAFTPAGVLDTSFGSGGRLLVSQFRTLNDVLVLNDGSILAAGQTNGYDFGVIKLLPNGQVDTTFGARGVATADLLGNEAVVSISLTSTGKIVVAGTTDASGNRDFAVARFDAQGNLDTTFDADGKQTVDFLGFDDDAWEAEVDASDRVVIAGSAFNGGNTDFALARLTAGGALDNSFGTAGRVRTDFAAANRDDVATTLELQSGGTIVLGGWTTSAGGDKNFALARYASNGSLLAGFGNNGQVVVDFTRGPNASDDAIAEIKIDSSGRIVALGDSFEGGALGVTEFATIVVNGVTGAIDNSFDANSGGRLYNRFFAYTNSHATSLEIDASGRWVSAGWDYSGYNMVVARSSGATGALDATFGNGGRLVHDNTSLTGDNDPALAVKIDAQGRILVATGDYSVARFLPSGGFDPTFGVNGVVAFDNLYLSDVVALPSGEVLAVGTQNNNFAVVKLSAQGTVVRSFGNNGIALAQFLDVSEAKSAVLQSDGALVVAGNTFNGANYDFAVARFTSDGNLDTTFSNDGLQTVDFVGFNDFGTDVRLDSQNRIVVAGTANNGNDDDFAVARLTTTGAPDNGFGTAGKVRTDITGANANDYAYALVIQAGDTIVVGGNTLTPAGNQDFALARYSSAGALLAGFGTNGKVVLDFGTVTGSTDVISDLQLDASGKLVALGYSYSGFDYRFALGVFDGTTGQLDASYDPATGGRLYQDFYSFGFGFGYALAIDGNGRWVAAGSAGPTGNIALARFGGNLAPVLDTTGVPSFGVVSEDATNPAGVLVSSLLSGKVADPDGPGQGMAVISLGNPGKGKYQYSLDGGATWPSMGTISENHALLLPANALIRFVPNADVNGQFSLYYRAWDQSQGTAGAYLDLKAAGVTGGSGPVSDAWEIAYVTVTAVNDAPVLRSTSTSFGSIYEDAANPGGVLVSGMLANTTADVDGDSVAIAVIALGNPGRGTYQYSLDNGSNWTVMTSISESNALLLPRTAKIRFLPVKDFNGTVTLYYRGWDQSQGVAGGRLGTNGINGGTGCFSKAFGIASLTVLPVNDAPVIHVQSPAPIGYVRGSASVAIYPSQTTITDVDNTNFGGGQLQLTGLLAGDLVVASGRFSIVGTDVRYTPDGQSPIVIGQRNTNGGQGTNLTITFNANATVDLVQRLIVTLRFSSTGAVGSRNVGVRVSDGNPGLFSNQVFRSVNVT
jgi:uncharacterized delta-60 repeat protein